MFRRVPAVESFETEGFKGLVTLAECYKRYGGLNGFREIPSEVASFEQGQPGLADIGNITIWGGVMKPILGLNEQSHSTSHTN